MNERIANQHPEQNGYSITENGQEYFIFGKNRIKVCEHFAEKGKTFEELICDVIEYEAKNRINSLK